MNRSFIVAVLTVTMLLVMSATVFAITGQHDMACDSCHAKHLGQTALTATNGCIACHSVLGEASRMPIDADAMSNYYGTTPNQPVKGSKSTHNYLATTPYNPRSMATDSANVTLNDGYNTINLAGNVYCVRCHDAKTNANTVPGSNKPYLRIPNVNDSLCLECHNSRNQASSATGTHPVFSRAYSTAYKLNTTAFRKVPRNANPYNPSSNVANYLKAGKIACSTCHAPHYADSSSATLDNRSTASGFAQDDPAKGLKGRLQESNGQLLRTDAFGVTADSVNICSSCHKESKNLNHNGMGQNIQCNHCHGAHVDYVGTVPDGELAPNLYLVRRDFSNMSTAKIKLGANKKVIYNTATSLRFARTDNRGICQVCHTPTPGVAIHDVADTRRDNCLECHTHASGFSASACTSCHGQPPMTSYTGGPNGSASQNYTVDESFTPHATHASTGYYNYACKNCHYDGTKPGYHNTGTGTFTDVFVDTTGSVGDKPGLTKNVPADYNPTDRTCSNVYCHSNGNPRGGTIAWKTATTPGWAFGKNTILTKDFECISCHESGNTLVTNAHYAHVTSIGLKCYVCHNATASASGGIADRTKHANGAKDVSFVIQPAGFKGLFTASFNSTDASCTNSCHGIATPVWTDTADQCGTCHAVPATSGSHTLHFTGTTGPNLGTSQAACSSCHTFAAGNGLHANGQIDVTGCTPCHPGSPVWTNAATVTCESCHTGIASVVGAFTAPLKNLNNTAGHGQYSSATLNVTCTSCHNASANHIGAGPTEKRLLLAGNDLCASCHTTAAGKGLPEARIDLPAHGGSVNNFAHYTSASDLVNIATVRADSCAGCHDTHGTTNRMSVRTEINGLSVAYTGTTPEFIATTPDGNGLYHGLCQVCHTRTKYFNKDTAPLTSHASGNCLSCHVHKGTHFAFEPEFGGCGGCHGYPPVRNMAGLGIMGNYTYAKFQDYSGGGGAHTVAGHIPVTAVQSEAWTNCNNCHNDSSHATGGTPAKKSFVNVTVDPKFKFNNATSITYNGNSCSNVSCHFQPSPNWVTGN